MAHDAAIFAGHVVHKRLRPKLHALDYRVFTFLLDVDRIDDVCQRLRLFSRNRFNLFSFHDRDHGAGDGTSIGDVARQCLMAAGRPVDGRRIQVLTYPRMLGYVFNPLSVFYVTAPDGRLETIVYEVSNTFAERKSYVVAAGEPQQGGVYAQACAKEMFVSPFASGSGGYTFRVTVPDTSAVVAVMFSDADGALIKTHFKGDARDMTDGALLRLVMQHRLLTVKVIAAIHYEAFKLWWKGVPLTARHVSPKYSTTPVYDHKQG